MAGDFKDTLWQTIAETRRALRAAEAAGRHAREARARSAEAIRSFQDARARRRALRDRVALRCGPSVDPKEG